jgi:hypothetical protein
MNQLHIFTSVLILHPLLLQKVEAATDFGGKKKFVSAHEGGKVSNYKKIVALTVT